MAHGTQQRSTVDSGLQSPSPTCLALLCSRKHVTTAVSAYTISQFAIKKIEGMRKHASMGACSGSHSPHSSPCACTDKSHASNLVEVCDEASFQETFGAPITDAALLIEKKVCTIPLLLKICPPGTTDPTPFLYNDVFYAIGGASAIAFVCNVAAFRLPMPKRW